MSYQTAATALRTTIAAVDGIKYATHGMPTSPHNLPLAYLEPDNGEHSVPGQVSSNTYNIALSILVEMHGMEHPDNQIGAFINTVIDAIDIDPSLGGGVSESRVTSWSTGYLEFGNPAVLTRRLIFNVRVTEKYANPWTPGG